MASFCRYAGEEHDRVRKAQSVLNLAESKDAEILRLKEEVKTLQGTLKADQEILVETRSALTKVETERDSAALQISSLQGDLDRANREIQERVQKEEKLLDEFRLSEEYETEVARKSSKMVYKTWERAVDFLTVNPNGDWAGFCEEFLRLDEEEAEAAEVVQEEPAGKDPEDGGSPLDPLNVETGETSGAQ